jgi:uncharacterized cofD-like protein
MRALRDIKVLSLGGGTGLSALLSGLKQISLHSPLRLRGHYLTLKNITAVVTVSDDGGSSGRLRDQFQTPAPGDIRNCLVALASDESLMTRLFRYRFPGDGELHDHSLGNLLLTALSDITGDFHEAVKLSSQVLAVEGQILPSTNDNVTLKALLEDGTEVYGESSISKAPAAIQRISLEPGCCRPLPETLEAIQQADVITIGPGSLFTSLVPNLLVPGVAEAIEHSPAVKIYVGNLMTQPTETTAYSASDHIRALVRHSGSRPIFEHMLVNSEPISEPMRQKYLLEGSVPVTLDLEALSDLGIKAHLKPLVQEGEVVRHNSLELAEAILEIFDKETPDDTYR